MFMQVKQIEKRWRVEKPQHTTNPICDNAETKQFRAEKSDSGN